LGPLNLVVKPLWRGLAPETLAAAAGDSQTLNGLPCKWHRALGFFSLGIFPLEMPFLTAFEAAGHAL
jgi:hypothetical protein